MRSRKLVNLAALNAGGSARQMDSGSRTPGEGDIAIRQAAGGQYAVCHCDSHRVLSTHSSLLDAVVACHDLANAHNVNVWQQFDSDGGQLREPRRLYMRRGNAGAPS